MVIDRSYARKMIREGKAKFVGFVTDAPSWGQREDGLVYAVVYTKRKYDWETDHDVVPYNDFEAEGESLVKMMAKSKRDWLTEDGADIVKSVLSS